MVLLFLAFLPVFGTAAIIPDPCGHPRLLLKAGEEAPVREVWEKKSRKGVWLPLTTFYGGDLDSCYRKVWLDRKDDLHVEDLFIGGDSRQDLVWKMCTEAEARILGPCAIELKKDGKTRILRIHTKHLASPGIWPTSPRHDYDAPNPGICLVGFEIRNVQPHEKVKVKVSLEK